MYGPLFDFTTIGQRRLNVNSPPSQVFVQIHLIEIIHLSQERCLFPQIQHSVAGSCTYIFGGRVQTKGTQLFFFPTGAVRLVEQLQEGKAAKSD